MPKISEFFGIAIYMYFRDHLPPHFHAFYGGVKGGSEVLINIRTMAVIRGEFPGPQLNFVRTWGFLYQAELLAAWDLAVQGMSPGKVPPLIVRKEKKRKKKGKGKK